MKSRTKASSTDRAKTTSKPKHLAPDLATRFPNVSFWALGGGWIEIGQDYRGGSYARALDEGGQIWVGKRRYRTLEKALKALDKGIAKWLEEWG